MPGRAGFVGGRRLVGFAAHGFLMSLKATLRAPFRFGPRRMKRVRPRYDCSKCPAYCCSYPRIAVSEFDIERLARHFGIEPAVARQRFTYRYRAKELDEQLLRHRKDHV